MYVLQGMPQRVKHELFIIFDFNHNIMKAYRILFVGLLMLAGYSIRAQAAGILIHNGQETIDLDSVTLIPVRFFDTKEIRIVSKNPQNPKQRFSIGVFANEMESMEYNIEGGSFNYKENYLDQFVGPNTQIVIGELQGEKVQRYVIRVLP